ncbi:LysR substrate-binding domain-containing protein [Ottowia sp.]|uniref:LysR substrate-binding domain-containing protein n=1 Tax=Ottowia sp. TaxID=1898956 RepID=UPI003A8B119C
MDLKQLAYFVRVAELESFTRASQALNVAQPALSRQVRQLEVELRRNLLVRNGRGVSVTDGGALLLAHGRAILHQVARAHEELASARGGLAGRVAVGLPPSVARAYAVPLVRAFRAQLPEAELSITEALSVATRDALMAGRLDIAVLYNLRSADGLDASPLMSEELVLVQAREKNAGAARRTQARRISWKALAQLPMVIPTRPNAIRMQMEAVLAAEGLGLQIAMEIDGIPAILELVAEGLGAAVLTRHAVLSAADPAAYTMRALGPSGLHVQAWLATSAQRPITRTQQAVVDLLRQVMGSDHSRVDGP